MVCCPGSHSTDGLFSTTWIPSTPDIGCDASHILYIYCANRCGNILRRRQSFLVRAYVSVPRISLMMTTGHLLVSCGHLRTLYWLVLMTTSSTVCLLLVGHFDGVVRWTLRSMLVRLSSDFDRKTLVLQPSSLALEVNVIHH